MTLTAHCGQPNNKKKAVAINLFACSFWCSFVAVQWGAVTETGKRQHNQELSW